LNPFHFVCAIGIVFTQTLPQKFFSGLYVPPNDDSGEVNPLRYLSRCVS